MGDYIEEAARRLEAELRENRKKRRTYSLWSRMPRLGPGATVVVMFRRKPPTDDESAGQETEGPGGA